MYLKSLLIKGFKTFFDKTTLDFEVRGHITAIVGPNGCGKSNILDAVRWVLGEQSSKNIRATLQEEVIFAGTQAKSPLSMAEVTLFFDNEDKLLPIDFSEVAIKRRVFREGESEFFINKSPCRLKDIKDLLMDTGLGSGSYSIINQGQVDAMLLASPEERRHIFEEVAGINRYRIRKEAAEKKLIAVEQHLLRLNDLKVEIGEQLFHLEEQAKKATEYKEIKGKLKELEIGLCKKQLQSFTERLEEWQQKIGSSKEEIEKAAKEKEGFTQKRHALRGQIRGLEEEERRVREELTKGANREEMRTKVFAKEGELAEKRNHLRDLQEKERHAAYEVDRSRQLLEKLQARLQEIVPQKGELEAVLANVKRDLEETQAAIKAKTGESSFGGSEEYLLEQLYKQLEDLQLKVDDLLEKISFHVRANTLEELMAGKEQLVLSLSNVGGVSQALREITARVKEVHTAKSSSGEEIASLHKKEKECSHQAMANELRLGAIIRELEESGAQIELCQKTIEVRGGELESYRAEKSGVEEGLRVGEEEKKGLEQNLSTEVFDLTQKLESLSKQREELEAQREQTETAIGELENREMESRDTLSRAEIQIAKLEGEAQSIGGRIFDEYSISLGEVISSSYEVGPMSKTRDEIGGFRQRIQELEPVNLLAIEEFERTKERLGIIDKGYLDLVSSRENLKSLIVELDKKARDSFLKAVEEVGKNFSEIFAGLFSGGEAQIRLTGEDDVLQNGIEIYARPSGRKLLPISALSGGEKALTAISLLFALLRTHPTPFCFLDEVDAPLDDANIHRFTRLLEDFSSHMQIVVITHNKNTMAAAETIYGITMEEPGVSKIVSMKLSQIKA